MVSKIVERSKEGPPGERWHDPPLDNGSWWVYATIELPDGRLLATVAVNKKTPWGEKVQHIHDPKEETDDA